MDNFELHSRAHELADSSTAYGLARKLVVAEEELAELRQSQQAQGRSLTDAEINEITLDRLGSWPSFEAQSWACKVVHALHPTAPAAVPDVDGILSLFPGFHIEIMLFPSGGMIDATGCEECGGDESIAETMIWRRKKGGVSTFPEAVVAMQKKLGINNGACKSDPKEL